MRFKPLSPAPTTHPLSRWAALLFLPCWLIGCATPAPIARQIPPPPADLAHPCDAGPEFPVLEPGAYIPLGALLEIARLRESAAAVCRARHAALVKGWPAAGAPQP